jgi:hypothetical protein
MMTAHLIVGTAAHFLLFTARALAVEKVVLLQVAPPLL